MNKRKRHVLKMVRKNIAVNSLNFFKEFFSRLIFLRFTDDPLGLIFRGTDSQKCLFKSKTLFSSTVWFWKPESVLPETFQKPKPFWFWKPERFNPFEKKIAIESHLSPKDENFFAKNNKILVFRHKLFTESQQINIIYKYWNRIYSDK